MALEEIDLKDSALDDSSKKICVKLVVIGDSSVGKSSLIHFFQKG